MVGLWLGYNILGINKNYWCFEIIHHAVLVPTVFSHCNFGNMQD